MSLFFSSNITLSKGYQQNSPWSNFRGNRQSSGSSNYVGPSTNELKWSFNTGDSITSTAAVAADGTVYFGSNDFNLYALSSYGTFIWKYLTGGITASSPAIGSDGTVYFGSYDFYFYSISSSGVFQWRYRTDNSIDSSPAIAPDSNAVYFTSNDMFLYALSLRTGSLLWKYQTTNNGFTIFPVDTSYVTSSPVVGINGTVFIGSKDKNIYAFSSSGILLWTFLCFDSVRSSPVLSDDYSTLYVSSSLNLDGPEFSSFYIYAMATSNGSQKWRTKLFAPVFSTPALGSDGTLYFATLNYNKLSYIYAISSEGNVVWQISNFNMRTQSSPAIGADGTLYFCSASSVLYAIASATGSVIWFSAHQNTVYKSSSPVIGLNGFLYMGSYDSTFYAYQSSVTLPPITIRPSFSSSFEVPVSVYGYQVDAPWSHFRGNDRYSGQSSLVGPFPTSSSSNLRLQWKYLTRGEVLATPVVAADGTIYIGSTDGKLYALSSLGTVKWSYLINNKVLVTTPTIGYDGTIYVAPDDYYIYALSSEGSLRWKLLTYKGVFSPIIGISNNSTNGSSSSTVSIYAAGEGYFYSWTYEGSLKWKYTLNSVTTYFNSPVLGMNSSVLYAGTSDSYLYALSSAEGFFLWKYQIDVPTVTQTLMFVPAIGPDDVIYFATYDSNIYAISPQGSRIWKYTYSDAVMSVYDILNAKLPAVAIANNGYVYIGSKDYSLYAISASLAGGSTLWQYKTDGEIYDNPVIGADGAVYFGSYDKNVYAVSAQGSLLWKYQTFRQIVGSAVIGFNNTLYIGSGDSYLYAITSTFSASGVDIIPVTLSPTVIVTKSSFQGNDKQSVVLSSQSRIIIYSVVAATIFVIVCFCVWFFFEATLQKKHERQLVEMKDWILSDGGGSIKVAASVKNRFEKEMHLDELSTNSSISHARYFGNGENNINMSACGSGDSNFCTVNNSDNNHDSDDNYSFSSSLEDSITLHKNDMFDETSAPSKDQPLCNQSSMGLPQNVENNNTVSVVSGGTFINDGSHLSHKVNEYLQMDQQLAQVKNSLKASNLMIIQHLEALQKENQLQRSAKQLHTQQWE